MLTDNVRLLPIKSGSLTATETLIDNIPKKTFQSLIVIVSMSAPEAVTLQANFKADPIGAAPNAAVQGLRTSVRTYNAAGVAGGHSTEITDATGLADFALTDSTVLEFTLPPMLMARSTSFSVGLKLASAPSGTATFVALLAQSKA